MFGWFKSKQQAETRPEPRQSYFSTDVAVPPDNIWRWNDILASTFQKTIADLRPTSPDGAVVASFDAKDTSAIGTYAFDGLTNGNGNGYGNALIPTANLPYLQLQW